MMGASKEGREGVGFRIKEVPVDKQPNEKNPYRSVAYVLCANRRPDNGQQCNKKVSCRAHAACHHYTLSLG